MQASIFNFSDIYGAGTCHRFCDSLRIHGYAIIEINASQHESLFTIQELEALAQWEEMLQDTFQGLSKQEKRLMGKYRSEKGVAVGYRDDDKREFIETHLKEGIRVTRKKCSSQVVSVSEDSVKMGISSDVAKAGETCVQRVVELTPPLRKLPLIEANIAAQARYTNTIVHLGYACRKVGFHVLRQISSSFPELQGRGQMQGRHELSVTSTDTTNGGNAVNITDNEDFFLKLTDLTLTGRRPLSRVALAAGLEDTEEGATAALQETLSSSSSCMCAEEDEDGEGEYMEDLEHSSSVLRLCNYPDEQTLLGTLIPSLATTDGTSTQNSVLPDHGVAASGQSVVVPSSRVASASTKVAYGFGAHTDTSFFTLGCCNKSAPGLEIFDRGDKQWKSVERDLAQLYPVNSNSQGVPVFHVVVFVGEFMQVLSNHSYMAVVHRVVAPDSSSMQADGDLDGGKRQQDQDRQRSRVSCPMIVRGKNKAVVHFRLPPAVPVPRIESGEGIADVDINTAESVHPPILSFASFSGADRAVSSSTANDGGSMSTLPPPKLALSYSGMNMKLIHLLLDKKRAKCMHAHQDSDDPQVRDDVDWVLSAFPEMHS